MPYAKHYLVETYHGPMLLSDYESSWTVISPCGTPENFSGQLPFECLRHAREIPYEEATRLIRSGMPSMRERSHAAA